MFRGPRLQSSGTLCAIAAGLNLLLALEFMRAWAVSLPLFYQGYLHVSEPVMGLAMFSPFLLALLAAPLLRFWKPGVLGLVVVAAASRLVLQLVGGGIARLEVSLVGLGACLLLLVITAPRRDTLVGLVVGLAADAVLLMSLKTESLVFRHGGAALVSAAAMSLLFVGSWFAAEAWPRWLASRAERDRRRLEDRQVGPAARERASLLAWLGFGPVLILHLTLGSLPASLQIAIGWGAAPARVLVALSYAIGGLVAIWMLARPAARGLGAAQPAPTWATAMARRGLARVGRWVVPLLAVACVGSALGGLSGSNSAGLVVAGVALPIGLVVSLALLSARGGNRSSPLVRLTAAAGGMLGVAVTFVYYLGFIYRYPLAPRWLLAGAVCCLLALLGVASLGVRRGALGRELSEETPEGRAARAASQSGALLRAPVRRYRWIGLLASPVALFMVVAFAFAGGDERPAPAVASFPLRVASYNIFMGLGGDVDLDLDRLAAQIARQKPDVVALQEVSRGWFTGGSVDLLPRLAERLGYSYHFYPATGATWGNAILTNLPSAEYAEGSLPMGRSAMQRGWGGDLLKLADGQDVLVVVTHLHHPADGQALRTEQAKVLVSDTLTLAHQQKVLPPTIVVGDLNAEPGAAELQPLASAFLDALAHGGSPLDTYPSWAPTKRIDHIFVSSGLVAQDPAVFGGLASDHLGIAVSLGPGPSQAPGGLTAAAGTDQEASAALPPEQ